MIRGFLLICLLVVGCRETVDVDLSGLSQEETDLFGSSYAVSLPLYALAEFGPPAFVNDRYVLELFNLCQRLPNEKTNVWEWPNGMEITFGSIVDMKSIPTEPRFSPGDLTIGDLWVFQDRESWIIVFKIDGLDIYQRGVTFYRVDLLVQRDGWYFVWGGYPVMDWRGYRALWFFGRVDGEDVERLVDGEEEILLLVEIRNLSTGEIEKAVKPLEIR